MPLSSLTNDFVSDEWLFNCWQSRCTHISTAQSVVGWKSQFHSFALHFSAPRAITKQTFQHRTTVGRWTKTTHGEERKMAQKSGGKKEEKKAKWTERWERFLNLETGLDMNAEIDCYLFGCFVGVRAAPALLCAHIDSINFKFSFHSIAFSTVVAQMLLSATLLLLEQHDGEF